MDGVGVRQIFLANGCVALFLCVNEEYQPYVTVAVTIAVLGYVVARGRARQV